MGADEGRESDPAIRLGRVRSRAESDSGVGLEAQRRALAAACRRGGWRILEPPVNSADATTEREHPRREAGRLGERGDLRALVAARRERPTQALAELASLLASAQRHGWALVTLDCTLEAATAAGEPLANLHASFAPCQQRLHSQRIREALARKRAQGVRLGRPPTMSEYAIERIKRERAAGSSLAAIANGLTNDRIPTAQGGRRWYPATVRYTLNRTP